MPKPITNACSIRSVNSAGTSAASAIVAKSASVFPSDFPFTMMLRVSFPRIGTGSTATELFGSSS